MPGQYASEPGSAAAGLPRGRRRRPGAGLLQSALLVGGGMLVLGLLLVVVMVGTQAGSSQQLLHRGSWLNGWLPAWALDQCRRVLTRALCIGAGRGDCFRQMRRVYVCLNLSYHIRTHTPIHIQRSRRRRGPRRPTSPSTPSTRRT